MDTINTWPGWEHVRELGAGSFGKVHEIRREDHGKTYRAALKVITIPSSQSEIREAYNEGMSEQNVTEYFQEFVENITEEFALMSEFKGQSNIVSYEDHKVIKHEDGIGWDILIRMEMLTPLSDWGSRHPLNEADVIAMGRDICHALELCWQKRIIHRDIKPENIFVSEYGDYKLGDFGIARTSEKTRANLSQKGTYTYIAPEVYRGQEYGRTADIYSLGMVLYRYLNENRVPFMPLDGTIRYNDREEAFKRRICGEQIPPPKMGSQALKEVVLKALAYAPEERYQSAGAFRKALEGCVKEIGDISDGTMRLFPNPKNYTEEEDPSGRKTQIIRQERQEETRPQEEPEQQGGKKNKMLIISAAGIVGLVLLVCVIISSGRKPVNPPEPQGTTEVSSEPDSAETPTDIGNTRQTETASDDVEPVTSEEVGSTSGNENFRLKGEASTYGRTSVLLIGDTTELWLSDGSFILFAGSTNIKWVSSNEAIAKISSQGIVTGISPGVVELSGVYEGKKSKAWQMTIVQEDKKSGVTVSVDYEKISLGVGASDTVMLTLHGTVADKIGAMCYTSSGLDMSFSWGGVVDGNIIPLNFINSWTTTVDEGDITVLFYEEDKPETIIAKTIIHVKVNK